MCQIMKAVFIPFINEIKNVEYLVETGNHKTARTSAEKQLKADGHDIQDFEFTVTSEADIAYPYETTIY